MVGKKKRLRHLPTTVSPQVLFDKEFRTRVKRRVDPTLWGAVEVILDNALDVLTTDLKEPDPFGLKKS